jgi:hypothetical protein
VSTVPEQRIPITERDTKSEPPPPLGLPGPGTEVPRRGWLVAVGLAAGAAVLEGCDRGGEDPWFTRIVEARRIAADLRVQFGRAADASNRSVMADTDEASIAFAKEAEDAKKAVTRDAAELLPIARAVGRADEAGLLEDFDRSFADYEALDRTILELAVENSNLKAQKLSFGPERESADAFRAALDAAARACSAKGRCRAEELVYGAVVALKDILILEPVHIAETEDAAMTKIEDEMSRLLVSARTSLAELAGLPEAAARDPLAAANAALARFEETRAQVVLLSRKNTNVRSLAMVLGPKRPLVTACDSKLVALQEALEHDGLKATR